MRRSLVIVSALGLAAVLWVVPSEACWQIDRPSAVVHGDYVQGHVLRNGKALVHSKVMLRGSSQQLQAEGITDTDGRFILRRVRPGKYRLQVGLSGDADIELRPADVNIGNRILKILISEEGCTSIESES